MSPLTVGATGGDGMSYLARGPSWLGIGSKGHPSSEPTPFRQQIVIATGGDSMSQCARAATATSGFFISSQAAP